MISVLDPTSIVGRDLVEALLESDPGLQLRYAHTSATDEHLITEVAGEASIVPRLTDAGELHGSRVVVVTVPPPEAIALALLAWLRDNPSASLVDLSQPGIGGDMATSVIDPGDCRRGSSRLFHLADPSVFAPIWTVRSLAALAPRHAAVTVLRPASTWGEEALHELAAQAAARLSGNPPKHWSRLPGLLAFDLAPAHTEAAFALARQVRAALAGVETMTLVADSGYFHGHAAALTLEFSRAVSASEVRSLLGTVPRLRIARTNQRVSLTSAVEQGGILCAGLTVEGASASMWVVCDGLREGVIAVGAEIVTLLSARENAPPTVQ